MLGMLKNRKGVTMIEYALLASLIAVALIVAITAMSGKMNTVFTTITSKL